MKGVYKFVVGNSRVTPVGLAAAVAAAVFLRGRAGAAAAAVYLAILIGTLVVAALEKPQ